MSYSEPSLVTHPFSYLPRPTRKKAQKVLRKIDRKIILYIGKLVFFRYNISVETTLRRNTSHGRLFRFHMSTIRLCVLEKA